MYPEHTPLHLPALQAAIDADTAVLRMDSRQIRPGDVFVACQGEYSDGRRYIADAIARGAGWVFWDAGDGFEEGSS